MHDLKENRCRCCHKVFCCKTCRVKHESKEHKIFPDCDICFFGRAVLTNASEKLIEHVKSVHWPLRCVFCRRFFGTVDEIKMHSKCPIGLKIVEDLEKSPYTPGQSNADIVYDSPPLSLLYVKGQQPYKNPGMFSNLATSTPMQGGDEKNLLEQIQEAITPVDFSEANKGSVEAQQVQFDGSLKRKVTFCETPVAESYRKEKKTGKKQQNEIERINSVPFSGNASSGIFYSVKEDPQEVLENEDEMKINMQNQKIPTVIIQKCGTNPEDKENVDNKPEDTTLWVSAVNTSATNTEEKLETPDRAKPTLQTVATPVVTKPTKKQVNVVMPTPVVKSSEINTKHDIANTKSEEPAQTKTETDVPIPGKRNTHDQGNTNSVRETVLETSLNVVQSRLWMSVSKLIKNVTTTIQGISNNDKEMSHSVKRRSGDYDFIDGPCVKRYKLTEIKCRRPIRELSSIEIRSWHIPDNPCNTYEYDKKQFVDKATQTDNYLLSDIHTVNQPI